MKKSVSRTLYLLAILLFIIGAVVFFLSLGGTVTAYNYTTLTTASIGNSTMALAAGATYALGGLFAVIAWIGALIKTAQLGRWGWFVFLIIFSGITMLIYIFGGPTTPVNQPVVYGAPMPPRY